MKKKLPYFVYALTTLVLSGAGLLASIYLTISHIRNYTDVGYSSFCAISRAINCDTVSQSPWSILLGLPVAVWGIFAYLIFSIFVLYAFKNTQEKRYIWDILFLLAFIFLAFDIYFWYIAAVKIKSYCIVCLFTYGVTLFLIFSTWIIRRRFNNHHLFHGIKKSIPVIFSARPLLLSLLTTIILFCSLLFFMPRYWIADFPSLSADLLTGVTEEGDHWIGAEAPELIIHEFTDYQCFQCGKMHLILRRLIDKYPDKIRLVHHHYPMDERYNTILVKEKFHTGSGDLALLAIAAGMQDLFWQTNDALYSIARQELTTFNIRKFAKKMNLDEQRLKYDMYSEKALKKLENDIRTGLKHNIIGTPSYIINNETFSGHLPANIYSQLK